MGMRKGERIKMMKYLQRLGKSLMLPVACLPAAGLLMGIGYWIDPTGWGANSAFAAFLIKAGSALIDNMAILFAIGVGVGMSDDNDGTAGLSALVSWLMITTLLSTGSVAFLKGIPVEEVPAAFDKIGTQFTGILAGIIGAVSYNRFKNTKLPDALSFFSGIWNKYCFYRCNRSWYLCFLEPFANSAWITSCTKHCFLV